MYILHELNENTNIIVSNVLEEGGGGGGGYGRCLRLEWSSECRRLNRAGWTPTK